MNCGKTYFNDVIFSCGSLMVFCLSSSMWFQVIDKYIQWMHLCTEETVVLSLFLHQVLGCFTEKYDLSISLE